MLTLVENVEGQHVIKGFARQREETEKFRLANDRVHSQKRSIFWHLSVYQPLTGLFTQLNMLVLIGYGGYLVIQGQLQLGIGSVCVRQSAARVCQPGGADHEHRQHDSNQPDGRGAGL